jgi:hypothetical protein
MAVIDKRMCQTCGERPKSGAYSNCFECLTENQIRSIEANRASRLARVAQRRASND